MFDWRTRGCLKQFEYISELSSNAMVFKQNFTIKVARHSLRARMRITKTDMPLICNDHFICSMPDLPLLVFFVIEPSVLIVLVFFLQRCWKKFRIFLCYQKNPVKSSPCAVA